MTAAATKRRITPAQFDFLIEPPPLDHTPPPRRRLRRTVGSVAAMVWFSLAALYLWCPVHTFPGARPFHGRRWYNPYASITPTMRWQKVNLHAHSRAWGGLTNGRRSADDVLRRYRAMGYDAAPVSNYQTISRAIAAESTALTVYEHGFNLRKMHFLAVGPRNVDWLDYPLLQGRDEEQHRIDRLRASAGAVIIAHPRLRHAIADTELRTLTGYTAMEISSTADRGDDLWNVALDAGRAVWGVASDDAHDVDVPNEIGRYWTMIAAPGAGAVALKDALIAGRVYAVSGRAGHADISLKSFALVGDTLSVEFDGGPAQLTLIGAAGRVIEKIAGARRARWVLPCDAPWARVVARTSTTRLWLEPVLRSESGALPRLESSLATTATSVRRMLALVLLLIALRGAWRLIRARA